MPSWVDQAYDDYAKRLQQKDCQLVLHPLAARKRNQHSDLAKIKQQEGDLLLNTIPKANRMGCMEVGGKSWSTEQLAEQMHQWMQTGQDISLLVGGPEGLSQKCLQQASFKWSLSPLTLPHPMVRVILAEQLYRAWSILHHLPYHR